MTIILYIVSMLACLVGKLCGMGGGVIIKPVLDAYGIWDIEKVNFLSACTVFGMCFWSVGKLFIKHESQITLQTSTPLGIGAALGGIIGKLLFSELQQILNANKAGGIQALFLLMVTFITLLYTIKKNSFLSFHVSGVMKSVAIGLFLGSLGAFLGIGGGPINMGILYLFYSMSTKVAAQNSLYIIFISQGTGLLKVLISGEIPAVSVEILFGMIFFGVLGSEIGSRINVRIAEQTVTYLFKCTMLLIMVISIYNMIHYM